MNPPTRKQPGDACDKELHANTFEEIAAFSNNHGQKMNKQGDEQHLRAMNRIKDLLQNPAAMNGWIQPKQEEFDALPDE